MIGSFRDYFEDGECNVDANELKPGDVVENINDECDHFKSRGVVIKMIKVPQDEDKTAGNICAYKVINNSEDFDPQEINGQFKKGDILKKTEIQLKKLNDS